MLVGCAAARDADSLAAPPILDDGWPVATLADSGFDLEKMVTLNQKLEASEYTNVHMVAVEYDGKLIYEKYLSGKDESWGSSVGYRKFD